MDQLAINYVYLPSINLYLPESIVVGVVGEQAEVWKSRALSEYVTSYSLRLSDKVVTKVVEICESLAPDRISEKYNRRGRSHRSLSELYADKELKSLIGTYIDRHMATLHALTIEHHLPIFVDAHRSSHLPDHTVEMATRELKPLLYFEKTQTGIRYRLLLQDKGETLYPSASDMAVISNEPGLIRIERCLHRLADISGNKIRPFLTKDSVFVPDKLVPDYFRKFVLPIAKKADIETRGFDLVKSEVIEGVRLEIVHDFLQDQWFLELLFDYGEAQFRQSEPSQRKVTVDLGDDQVVMYQTSRSADESQYIQYLKSLGLQGVRGKLLLPQVTADAYTLIEWVTTHKGKIQQTGITLPPMIVEGRKITSTTPTLTIDYQLAGDWLDIHSVITLGEYTIPFEQVLPFIREGNRLFPLADGTYLLIPSEWMATYKSLGLVASADSTRLRIHRSQEAILPMAPSKQSTSRASPLSFDGHPDLKAELRPYQKAGVSWLIQRYESALGGCLADDMGLGKTIQTLALLNYVKDQITREHVLQESQERQLSLFASTDKLDRHPLRALIVLPTSLVFNWYEEIRRFSPRLITTQYVGHNRSSKMQTLEQFDIVLTTYATAVRDQEVLGAIEWEYLILDESHAIKNRESKTFKALYQLPSKHRLTLTGTPIENSLSDLWSQMHFLIPDLLGSHSDFERDFVRPITSKDDEETVLQLRKLVDPYILRRRKAEVASDLPPLQEQIIYTDMSASHSKLYDTEKSAARNAVLGLSDTDSGYNVHVLTALMRLRQLANHPRLVDNTSTLQSSKVDMVIEQVVALRSADHKILVFSSFTTLLDLVAADLADHAITYCQLTGASSARDRQRAVQAFQANDDIGVFLISIKAGGTGLNLTAASYVMILDPWWNPFVEEQAIARAHRIGQTQPISVLKFIARDTIEEKILRLQARKKVLSAEIVEADQQIQLSKEELAELLK